jgi:hypothetical protein
MKLVPVTEEGEYDGNQSSDLDDLQNENTVTKDYSQFDKDRTGRILNTGEFVPITITTKQSIHDVSERPQYNFDETSLSSVGSNEDGGKRTGTVTTPGTNTEPTKTDGSVNENDAFSSPTGVVSIPDATDNNPDNKSLHSNLNDATASSKNVSPLSAFVTKLRSQNKAFWIIAIVALILLIVVVVLLSKRKSNHDEGADKASATAPVPAPALVPTPGASQATVFPSQQVPSRPVQPFTNFSNVTNSTLLGPTIQPNGTSSQSPTILQFAPSPVQSIAPSPSIASLPSLLQATLSPQLGTPTIQTNTSSPAFGVPTVPSPGTVPVVPSTPLGPSALTGRPAQPQLPSMQSQPVQVPVKPVLQPAAAPVQLVPSPVQPVPSPVQLVPSPVPLVPSPVQPLSPPGQPIATTTIPPSLPSLPGM